MNEFVPREIFQSSRKDESEALAQQAVAPWMRTAMVYAYSQLALNGATADELRGAKSFIQTFLNLSETPNIPPTYPSKPLEHV